MAEVIAGAASVAGLVDIGFRTSQHIWTFCRNYKHSLSDARQLEQEFTTLACTISGLENAIGTEELKPTIVRSLQESIHVYKAGIDDVLAFPNPVLLPKSGFSARVARAHYTFKKPNIQRARDICMNLMSHLGLVLSMLCV